MKRIILLSLLSAYIWAGDLGSYNLNVVSELNKSGKIETIIQTPGNMILSVLSEKTLTLEQEDLVGRTFQTFFNWSELNIKSTKLVFEGRKLSILFELDVFIHKGEDITKYMPSGIQLYYDTFYEYDFRMFKDGLFMRLKGQYYSKKEFLDELYNAINDPILYIQIHDPSYIIRQIDELKSKNQEQDIKVADLEERHEALLREYLALLDNYTTLKKEQNGINEGLKNGVISLSNRSFWGSLNEYSRDTLNRVIDIKTANTGYTVKDVEVALKPEGIKTTSKFIEAIFIIYFNEFPQNLK